MQSLLVFSTLSNADNLFIFITVYINECLRAVSQ